MSLLEIAAAILLTVGSLLVLWVLRLSESPTQSGVESPAEFTAARSAKHESYRRAA